MKNAKPGSVVKRRPLTAYPKYGDGVRTDMRTCRKVVGYVFELLMAPCTMPYFKTICFHKTGYKAGVAQHFGVPDIVM